jgi:hypothetical protein
MSATLKQTYCIVQFGTDYAPFLFGGGYAVDVWFCVIGAGGCPNDAVGYQISESTHFR